MRKRIAVFVCAISFSNQRKILEGILDEAGKADMDVFVFTCHVNPSVDYMKMDGAFSVMALPDLANFNGAIIVKNTIQSKRVADELEQRIKTSGIPSISIDEDIDGMHMVGINDFEAQKKVMEELISSQRCRRISYVAGIIDNHEGAERLRAYEAAMTECGLSYRKEDIFLGDYTSPAGRKAAKHFMQMPTLPEAIVCANDGMVLGVLEGLREAGIRVPEDVKVTGFDNDDYAKCSMPSITTIDRNQRELGRIAVQLIRSNHKGYEKRLVDTTLILRESSGKKENDPSLLQSLREAYSKDIGIMMQAIDTIKNMSLELAGLESISELCERMKKYILTSDMEACFLCMENEDGFIDIPLAFTEGEFFSFPAFEKGTILPNGIDHAEKPAFYTVMALYYSDNNFGYVVQRNSHFTLQSELAFSWVINVGNAIENIKKLTLTRQMVEKLNTMWMYDTLTNIYNRGGFFHYAETLLQDLKNSGEQCYLIFMDLDGLKAINDRMGHEAGDITDLNMLIEEADKKMYEAKRKKRSGERQLVTEVDRFKKI